MLPPTTAALGATKPLTSRYRVVVDPLALAHGRTVTATATVTSPDPKVKSWWSNQAVSTVVRKGVNGGYQRPYVSEGYRCSTVVSGSLTSFTCKLMGADVPTAVRLTFAVTYRGATASG